MPRYLFGPYELLSFLGEGGMGAVYRARKTAPQGITFDVALKLLRTDTDPRIQAKARFLDEMRIIATAHHPNVVRLQDVGEEENLPYIAMEYLDGISLRQLWNWLEEIGASLPPDLVAALFSQAARGLHAIHTLRKPDGSPYAAVHRDLSPHNLMCTLQGIVKVIDFGIVWLADREHSLTPEGKHPGKLSYSAPELLFESEPPTPAADIFCIGIMLHEFLTGARLFYREEAYEIVGAVKLLEIPPIRSVRPDVSPRLERIVMQALERVPKARHRSALVLADELDAVVRDAGGIFSTPAHVADYLKTSCSAFRSCSIAPLLAPPPFARTEPDPSGSLFTITVPPAKEPRDLLLPNGSSIIVETVELDSTLTLPSSPFSFLSEDVLPTPLIFSPAAGSIRISYLRDPKSRTSLYSDALDSRSRVEEVRVSTVSEMKLELGHRTTRVQSLYCDSKTQSTPSSPLCVDVPRLGASFLARADSRQLTILHTVDADTGTIHAICIRLR